MGNKCDPKHHIANEYVNKFRDLLWKEKVNQWEKKRFDEFFFRMFYFKLTSFFSMKLK